MNVTQLIEKLESYRSLFGDAQIHDLNLSTVFAGNGGDPEITYILIRTKHHSIELQCTKEIVVSGKETTHKR